MGNLCSSHVQSCMISSITKLGDVKEKGLGPETRYLGTLFIFWTYTSLVMISSTTAMPMPSDKLEGLVTALWPEYILMVSGSLHWEVVNT